VDTALKVLAILKNISIVLVLPIATGVASVVITANEEPIERPVAAAFLIHYWQQAPRHPEETWQLLTPEWRARSASNAHDPYRSYQAFVSRFRRIEATHVRSTDRENYFDVAVVFTPKKAGAKPVTEHLTYGLHCDWWDGHVPVFECDADELSIADGYPTDRPTAP
jgi:hypothetical protein